MTEESGNQLMENPGVVLIEERPKEYSPELGAMVCSEIADGKSIRTICANKAMPSINRIFQWLATIEDFQKQYARAKEEQAEIFTEEMVDIADAEHKDVQHRRLQIDTRKWLASKLKPKKYGEKQEIEHSGNITVKNTMYGSNDT